MSIDFDDPKVRVGWYRDQYRDVLADPDDQVTRILAYGILDLAGNAGAQAALYAELKAWIEERNAE